MIFLQSDTFDPYFNLATEEYLLKNFDDDIFYLYRNSPSIIIGKNQNALNEINYEYVTENKIPVVRRLSGGGAVFHDLGNLNFCFITEKHAYEGLNFEAFTQPIIEALKSIGINAEFSGRNDLTIDGKKFSGNAQYHYNNRVLHHGTLLFSANISNLTAGLKTNPLKLKSKGIKSIKSRVTNISSHLTSSLNIEDFVHVIARHIMSLNSIDNSYELSSYDHKKIADLVLNKYNTWEWTYGKSPAYSYNSSIKYKGGIIEYYLDIDKGIIKRAKFYGDFFGVKNIAEIENILVGVKHEKDALIQALIDINLDNYFAKVKLNEFIDGFFESL